MLTTFILLLSAHVFGDFLLQTNAMVRNKGKGWVLLFHTVLHGALAYGLLQQWSAWPIPVSVAVMHSAIDWVKGRCRRSARAFVVDQVSHVVSLAVIAAVGHWLGWCGPFEGQGWQWIVGFAGFVASVFGVGFYVGEIAGKLAEANGELADSIKAGLRDGGKQIGRLERALIFAFILVGEPTGIGFLVAAKSILRFEDAKQRLVAEYVIIGTLWSFGLAMALAWLTQQAIGLG